MNPSHRQHRSNESEEFGRERRAAQSQTRARGASQLPLRKHLRNSENSTLVMGEFFFFFDHFTNYMNENTKPFFSLTVKGTICNFLDYTVGSNR